MDFESYIDHVEILGIIWEGVAGGGGGGGHIFCGGPLPITSLLDQTCSLKLP